MTELYAWLSAFFHKRRKMAVVKQGQTICLYGRVNHWHESRKTLVKELNLIADNGLAGYMIEMAVDWTSDKAIQKICKEYKWLVKQCRRRNLILFNSITNDNLGRHGGKRIADYYSRALMLLKCVKECGNKGVYIQPVAETQTDGGRRFEKDCVAQIRNYNLVYNGGSRPSGPASGFTWFAVHPSKIDAKSNSKAWVVSDHSLLIKELNGGPIDGHGYPPNVQRWVVLNRNLGVPVIGYYAYMVKDLDKNTIKTIGSAR